MPEFYRLGMTKEEINDTLQTAVREPQPVVAGNFAVFTEDGQIIDSEKSAADFAPASIQGFNRIYVNANTGDDRNDGKSTETAKRTIQAAINSIPKLLTNGRVIIEIAEGIYKENVNIDGFVGSMSVQEALYLTATGSAENTVLQGTIKICSTAPMWLRNLSLRASGTDEPLLNAYFSCISMTGCVLDASEIGGTSPAIRSVLGQLHMTSTSIRNAKSSAIQMSGTLFATGLNGSGNKIGLQNYDPIGRVGLITTSKLDAEFAETLFIKAQGGAIIENGVLV